MAPKRSRTEVGSSSSGGVKYDKKYFVTKKAYEHYMLALEKNKAWIPERGIDLTMHHPYPRLMFLIEHRKWFKLCEQPQPAVTPIVREFYANATARTDSKAVVRGVEVSFSPMAINRYYELPDIIHDNFSLSESNLNPEAILRVIGSDGARWRFNENPLLQKVESKFMQKRMKIWHRFVGAKLMPTKHFGTVDILCGNLIRAIETPEDTIDVGKIINKSIHKSMQATHYGFYHPCLITELCRQAGVKMGKNEELYKPIHIINRNTIARFESPPPPDRNVHGDDEDIEEQDPPEQPHVPPVPEPQPPYGLADAPADPQVGRHRTMQDRMQDLETEVHRARLDIRAQYQQMETLMTNMRERDQRDATHYARMEAHADTMELHNRRYLEFAAYQDMCFRMQQTHLNPGFDVFPNAPIWLPQYPPMPSRNMGEGVGDNDDGADGGNGDDAQGGHSGSTQIVNFDED